MPQMRRTGFPHGRPATHPARRLWLSQLSREVALPELRLSDGIRRRTQLSLRGARSVPQTGSRARASDRTHSDYFGGREMGGGDVQQGESVLAFKSYEKGRCAERDEGRL